MRKTIRLRAAAFFFVASFFIASLGVPSGFAAPAGPPPAGIDFLPGFTIAIPPGSKVAARLVVPPAPEAVLEKRRPSVSMFAVGPGDAVWFGTETGALIHGTKGFSLRLAVPFSDIAVLERGALLVAGGDALGFLVVDPPSGSVGGGKGTMSFQPIVTLPLVDARLSAGGNGALYLFGTGKESGRHEVFLLRPEPASTSPNAGKSLRTIRKIFSTTEKLSAVSGDGDVTFVATGRLVLKITPGPERIATAFLHPTEEITDLAFSRAHGLFYATASGVGYAGPNGTVEFLYAPNAAIRLVDGALYVFLKNSLAVVKVEGIDAFRNAPTAGPKP